MKRRWCTLPVLSALAVVWLLLTCAVLFAEEDKKAADLVEDGQAIDLANSRYQELFAELKQKHNFTQADIDTMFKGVSINRRVLELMDKQWEAKPYFKYHPLFITWSMISTGKRQLEQHRELLDKIEKELGVEREVLVAIWGIESKFGNNHGAFNMFETLNTMFDAYPRRSKFYRQELIEYLLLCRENSVDPKSVNGSYGGAFGQTQFIPSSFRAYAVDFDKDGKRDVWQSIPDVLASIANYLKQHGWTYATPIYHEIGGTLKSESLREAYKKGRKGLVPLQEMAKVQEIALPASPGDKPLTVVGLELDEEGGMRYVAGYPNFQAITRWNNSNRYAMAVTELAEQLKK